MKPINYYTLYKNRKPKTDISFMDWLQWHHKEIDVTILKKEFFNWWLSSKLTYLNNNVQILWFCKNFKPTINH